MSTTKEILNLMATPTTVEVPFLVRASFEEVSSSTSNDGLDRVKVFQYTGGDEDNPMSLNAAVYRNPSKNAGLGEVVTTYRIDTYAREVNDSSGEVIWIAPVAASITLRVPGVSAVVDSADILCLLGNLYTAFFATVDESDNPTSTVVDKLKYNVPAIS